MRRDLDKQVDECEKDIAEILKRVDRLPRIKGRISEEIIGYDENGLPAEPVTVSNPPESTEQGGELWQQILGREMPPAVKFFLEHRHREWELENERSGTKRDPEEAQ